MIRVLYIEDSPTDRTMFRSLMFDSDGQSHPWWRDVSLLEMDKPLDSIEDYGFFDGVIFDFRLPGGKTGYEVAQLVHLRYPFLPIMLLTGTSPADMPSDAREWVDHVAYKWGAAEMHPLDQIYGVTRAFLRHISGLRAAANKTTGSAPMPSIGDKFLA